MAIRFGIGSQGTVMTTVAMSGWRSLSTEQSASVAVNTVMAGMMHFQPSALSRPGNLGTAYTGVWTEDVSSANDAHRPIPFKLLTAASLLYPTGLHPALIGR